MKSRTSPLLYIILLSLVIHFIAFGYSLEHPLAMQTIDSDIYLNAARNISETGVFHSGYSTIPESLHEFSHRPPGYPLVISGMKAIWNSEYSTIALQVILHYLNFFLLWRIMSIFKVRDKLKLFTAAIFLLYPPQIFLSYMIIAEVLLQTFLLLSLLFLALYLDGRKARDLFLCNLMLCLAVLTKPLFIYFWIPNMIFHIFLFMRDRNKLILLMPLLLVAVVFSWSLRNYYHTDYFHYSSSKHRTIVRYYLKNYTSSKHGLKAGHKFIKEVNDETARLDFPEASRYIEKLGRGMISSDWLWYAQFHLRGVVFFFADPGRFELYQFMDIKELWNRGFQYHIMNFGLVKGSMNVLKEMPLGPILYLGVMGSVNALLFFLFVYSMIKRDGLTALKIFLILVVLYVAIVTGPLGASRYRLPVFPFMLAAIALFSEKPEDKTPLDSNT